LIYSVGRAWSLSLALHLADFPRSLSAFEWRCGPSGLSDLSQAGFDFRFNAMGLRDDAVECCGLFLKFSGVVVWGRHVTPMLRILGTL
jgi:hypothetical protein